MTHIKTVINEGFDDQIEVYTSLHPIQKISWMFKGHFCDVEELMDKSVKSLTTSWSYLENNIAECSPVISHIDRDNGHVFLCSIHQFNVLLQALDENII